MTETNKLSLKAARGTVVKLSRFAARDEAEAKAKGCGAQGTQDNATPKRDLSEYKSSTVPFSARKGSAFNQGRSERGERGFRGERDERGYRGERDERGYRGERDERGYRGERDERGYRGERSERGFRGERDERGFRGSRGDKFERGGKFEHGAKFERGDKFERGFREGRPHGANAPRGQGYGANRTIIDVTKTFETSVPLGRMVSLPISEVTDKGVFVNAAEHGALFVPRSQVPEGLVVGSELRVCLYKDGARVLATARRPVIELGQVGNLRVNSINNGTAYLDMGIPKELVFPVAQQRVPLRAGDTAMVYVAIDTMGRLFATQRFNDYIRERAHEGEFTVNQKVKVVPLAHTPLGFRVVINDQVYGLIYKDEQPGHLTMGKRYEGFIKEARADGRLDVSLQEVGLSGIEHAALDILKALYYRKGHFDFNDKSDPALIESTLQLSKGKFKKALGMLYKQRLVVIGENDVTITDAGRAKMQNELGAAKPVVAPEVAEPSAVPDEQGHSGDRVVEDLLDMRSVSSRQAAHAAALQVTDDKLTERSKERLAQVVADAVDTGEGEA